MTEEQIALARRAVACMGWRWMPGMADCYGRRLREGDWLDPAAEFPDLQDPATVGCLVALVRKARNEPTGFASVVTPEPSVRWAWVNGRNVSQRFFVATTEAEALVLALESVS